MDERAFSMDKKTLEAAKQEKEKSIYQKVIDGDIEPEGREKGYKNLLEGQRKHNFAVIDPEKRREIQRKGAEAVNRLHGEKKTARESLEQILTLKATDDIIAAADLSPELAERLKRDNPNATLYDLIQIVAAGRAVSGNMKAYELIRDTYGDKPHDTVEINANITTDQDRELLQQINARLRNVEMIQVIDQDSSSEREKSREKEPKRE